MAKKHSASISNAIRHYLEQHPTTSAKVAIDALAKAVLKVSSALFYNVKGRMTQIKVHKKRKAKRAAAVSEKTGSSDPIALIVRVKELAKEASGLQNLKALFEVLEG